MLEELRKAMAELRRIFAGNPVAEAQDRFHEAVHATLADLDARVKKLEHPDPVVLPEFKAPWTEKGEPHEG